MFEPHQVSRYFDKRPQIQRLPGAKAHKTIAPATPTACGRDTNKRMPKLSLAVQASSHLILAACPSIGMGFWITANSMRCLHGKPQPSCAAGTDAGRQGGMTPEANHRLARQTLGIQSLIPPRTVRPGARLNSPATTGV